MWWQTVPSLCLIVFWERLFQALFYFPFLLFSWLINQIYLCRVVVGPVLSQLIAWEHRGLCVCVRPLRKWSVWSLCDGDPSDSGCAPPLAQVSIFLTLTSRSCRQGTLALLCFVCGATRLNSPCVCVCVFVLLDWTCLQVCVCVFRLNVCVRLCRCVAQMCCEAESGVTAVEECAHQGVCVLTVSNGGETFWSRTCLSASAQVFVHLSAAPLLSLSPHGEQHGVTPLWVRARNSRQPDSQVSSSLSCLCRMQGVVVLVVSVSELQLLFSSCRLLLRKLFSRFGQQTPGSLFQTCSDFIWAPLWTHCVLLLWSPIPNLLLLVVLLLPVTNWSICAAAAD